MLKQDFDVKKSTPVALAMRNFPEMLILMMGIATAGGVVVFPNPCGPVENWHTL